MSNPNLLNESAKEAAQTIEYAKKRLIKAIFDDDESNISPEVHKEIRSILRECIVSGFGSASYILNNGAKYFSSSLIDKQFEKH